MTKMNQNQTTLIRRQNNEAAQERLLYASSITTEQLLNEYHTNLKTGYTQQQASDMLEQFGSNRISRPSGSGLASRLLSAFVNPFTIVLLILAGVSLVTDVILAPRGAKDPVAVMIIVTMVTISGVLRFTQESRSQKAAVALSEMVETTIAIVRQETGQQELPIDEIVTGDLICLTAGDMIPADLRILSAKDLFVSQSSLTGESEPVEKISQPISDPSCSVLERSNLAFMGSNVISGSALALAITIGDDTIFGSLAQEISRDKPTTSFEKGVSSVSWILIRLMMMMVPIVFVINGLTKGSWMDAFLFALSVAVGLTPEMLPMLVSANLSRGAVAMSKQKVIVKDLNSIQNFGAMDVLCTDKTGTLTQDQVVLLYSLDVHGKEDTRVLRHAFLNSNYQTGLKNLMDIAILNYAAERNLGVEWNGYQKVDEIPFDFTRRRMSVLVASEDGKTQLITKGAMEEMLAICAYAEYQGSIIALTDDLKEEIKAKVIRYNEEGMRVLCVAQKSSPSQTGVSSNPSIGSDIHCSFASGTCSIADESDMVLMGYLAFLDPPKESTASAIQALHEFGVDVKILTGDNDAVTGYICRQVGIEENHMLLGSDIHAMDDAALDSIVQTTHVFAKLSPLQKSRVVTSLKRCGHTVGFLGDGINDAAAMQEADVGISVDTAVDIAKETADIILMEKDLMVLEKGVIEGRKTYANLMKYIKMTASSNFGNMLSVLAASSFLPFLPMLPIQLLALNLIYDLSCLTIPWDHVEEEYLKKPRSWDASSISRFMLIIGPSSSVFDILTYLFLYFVLCPLVAGGSYHSLNTAEQTGFIALFQTGWFIESLWTQTLVIHMIRSPKIPFIESHASWQLSTLTTAGILLGTILPFGLVGTMLSMAAPPALFFPFLLTIILSYMAAVTLLKKNYINHFGELL